MVESVGSVNQSGTTTYVTGVASGLDTNALIEAAYNQKLEPADTIDAKVEANAAKIEAYNELLSLTTALQDSLDALSLKTATGESNIFDEKTGSVLSSNGVDPANYLDVDLDDGAADGTYQIEILQTAQEMVVASDSQSSKTDALGLDGSFSLQADDGTAVTINVTADMGLQSIATVINAVTSTTGVTAMVVLVAPGEYQLSLSSVNEAMLIEAVFVSGANVLQSLGVLDEFGDFANVTQSAQQAIVEVNGVQMTRNSNTIDDAIEGITLDLKNAAVGVTMTLEVESDTSSIKDAILDFVEAYNNLRTFVLDNQSISSEGEVSEEAVLFADGFLRSLSQELGQSIGQQYGEDSLVKTLRDIGITYDSENYLVTEEAALDDALLEDLQAVTALFETQVMASDDSQIKLITYNNSNALSFDLDITVDGNGTITSVSANGDSSAFRIDGSRIIGREGTAYEGLTFAFAGSVSTTISIDIEPGFADVLSDILARYTDSVDGLINEEMRHIEDLNDTLNTEADRIRERADAFLEKQIAKYSAMESAVLAAETLQNYIEQILGGGDDE